MSKKKIGPKRGRSSTTSITIKAERKIVELYVESHYGSKRIVKYMEQRGYHAPRGGRWSKTTVVKILQANGVYHEGRRVRDEQEKFWSSTRKGDNGCILWTGCLSGAGYGRFKHNGVMRYAYQAAWEFVHGPKPRGTHLHHVCKNKLCVEQAHLLHVPDAAAHAKVEKMERAFVEAYHAEMLALQGDAVLAACV